MSEKLKCLVLDDEPLGREIIEEYVNKTPFLELSASFGKPLEALSYLQEKQLGIEVIGYVARHDNVAS